MTKKIFFFVKLLTIILMFSSNLYADEFLIIPKKKPILDKITKQKKK